METEILKEANLVLEQAAWKLIALSFQSLSDGLEKLRQVYFEQSQPVPSNAGVTWVGSNAQTTTFKAITSAASCLRNANCKV